MTIGKDSSIEDVVAAVAAALDEAGIRAVLTGGAAAVIYTGGEYQSEDLDFVLQSSPSQKTLDAALSAIGFSRKHDHYVHARTDFFVEFPRGPLSIGRDIRIRPVQVKIGKAKVVALSATDSCRDRLAAFYHWSDRQSLDTAVQIARRQRVDMTTIREWSLQEGMVDKFDVFERQVGARRSSG